MTSLLQQRTKHFAWKKQLEYIALLLSSIVTRSGIKSLFTFACPPVRKVTRCDVTLEMGLLTVSWRDGNRKCENGCVQRYLRHEEGDS